MVFPAAATGVPSDLKLNRCRRVFVGPLRAPDFVFAFRLTLL
jgi:hypothetical protein